MKDIEKAYRILGLKPGAPLKEIDEAHEDLLVLWNPDRLKDRPRLKVQGKEKIREINEAYQALIEHLAKDRHRRSKPASASSSEESVSRAPRSNQSFDTASSSQPVASLYEELFSGRQSKKQWNLPVLLLVVLGVIVMLFVGVLTQSWEEESPEFAEPLQIQAPGSPVQGSTRFSSQPESQAEPDVQESQSDASESGEFSSEPTRRSKPDGETSTLSRDLPSSKTESRSAEREVKPALLREEKEAPTQKSAAGSIETEPSEEDEPSKAEDAPTELEIQAYHKLVQNSVVAGNLVNGGFDALRFREWRVVQTNPSETWIDLIATRDDDGNSVHFIWSVERGSGLVRPLSQAARNLEMDTSRR